MSVSESSTPFFFRQAYIIDVDPKNLTCDLLYGDPTKSEFSHSVPLPSLIGAGNVGLIVNHLIGTRVIAAYLHDTSGEIVVIVAVLPSNLQKSSDYNFASEYLIDKNVATTSYPQTMEKGDAYLSAHAGPSIWLKNNDSLYLSSANGNGIFLVPGPADTHNLFSLANNHSTEGSGGRLSWGRVKREFSNIGWNTIQNFNTDILRDGKLRDIGFWLGSKPLLAQSHISSRNPALSEYKLIINEFATEFGVSGLDKEIYKNENQYLAAKKDPILSRYMESTNSLALSESELIEIIGGNLVDINGNILDINYNPVEYSLLFPTIDSSLKLEEAIRKSRRGIGYHFKLSTNSRSSDKQKSINDFIFDVDKEGMLKVNIPKSSTTGNIPYITDVNFVSSANSRFSKISASNPTIREKIPVSLRNSKGEPVGKKDLSGFGMTRETGIRFANYSNDSYFPIKNESGNKTIRINTTKHHNIYSAAERLIANYVNKIHIPAAFVREEDRTIGKTNLGPKPKIPSDPNEYSYHSSFEKRYEPSKLGTNSADNKTDVTNVFYSAIDVSPAPPAISTGGDTFVGGRLYSSDDQRQPLISNYFKTAEGSSGIEVSPDKVYKNVVPHGGVSANVNLEGSLEMSVGGDNVDNKSLILDTAGSLVMWLGKDKNNRSLIFQSDGDVLFNIGGSYTPNSNPNIEPEFNSGRFDMRVNVVDKGFFDSTGNRSRNGEAGKMSPDEPYSSDYLISISSEGLIISGMKAGAPMVIRNDGPLMLESASNKLTLKGMEVEIVDFAKLPTDDGRSRE